MNLLQATYPTQAHKETSEIVVAHFQQVPETEATLLVNSCARGRATRNSCLDMIVFVAPEVLAQQGERLKAEWLSFCQSDPNIATLRQAGQFAEVHLDFVNGRYTPPSAP